MLVLGGGTSGAVLAGWIAERSGASVLLLEAGPITARYSPGGGRASCWTPPSVH